MTAFFQVLPLAVLLIGAVLMVWRGLKKKNVSHRNQRYHHHGSMH